MWFLKQQPLTFPKQVHGMIILTGQQSMQQALHKVSRFSRESIMYILTEMFPVTS